MIDNEILQAMQNVLDLLMPGAEITVEDNDLAETQRIELFLTLGAATTLSNEQTEDFDAESYGAVMGQLIEATRLFALQIGVEALEEPPEAPKRKPRFRGPKA